ncbi:carboxymuconolactone decarboxylase family protein [Nocardia goodfellowii]|uniref:Alkylhydroperoxidase family enzyme n=1 Tax=Nocardia goodfellowii TaxID=882446 RepID=A0ABS4QLI5_9NOCA|nr:carboxymuconolactone decarboxylase family protein [Nocardia goodfellowii]MBP2192005.1 alkylhydroperoxidase family enzyme [Nocardia goodfellowii]
MPRIPPTPEPDWSAEMTAFIQEFRNSARTGKPKAQRQSGANLLGTLARYPALAQPFLLFNRHLLQGNSLSVRHRELLILRVAHLRGSDYEWAQHVLLAADAGLGPRDIARIAAGPDTPGWPPTEQNLLRSADELLLDGSITESTWHALAAEFTEHQLMDIVFTVGAYALVAMALRSFGVEPEPGLVPHLPVRP